MGSYLPHCLLTSLQLEELLRRMRDNLRLRSNPSTGDSVHISEPCILSLPPPIIRRGITEEEYRAHYQTPLGMDTEAPTRLMNIALAEFHKSSYVERGLSTSTCLLPQEKLGTIKDVTVGGPHSYLVGAGQRLVLALKGTESA